MAHLVWVKTGIRTNIQGSLPDRALTACWAVLRLGCSTGITSSDSAVLAIWARSGRHCAFARTLVSGRASNAVSRNFGTVSWHVSALGTFYLSSCGIVGIIAEIAFVTQVIVGFLRRDPVGPDSGSASDAVVAIGALFASCYCMELAEFVDLALLALATVCLVRVPAHLADAWVHRARATAVVASLVCVWLCGLEAERVTEEVCRALLAIVLARVFLESAIDAIHFCRVACLCVVAFVSLCTCAV